MLPEVVAGRDDWKDREVYICGPAKMIWQTRAVLAGLGVPAERLHYDDPDPLRPAAGYGRPDGQEGPPG
jgi:ferredoxin-NADP reductase